MELIAHYHLSDADEFARDGGLLSLGIDGLTIGRRSAEYIHRILQGARPSDLPVVRPELVLTVNLSTAKTLGIEVPPAVLLRADEVIA